jgi:hypothetical protein
MDTPPPDRRTFLKTALASVPLMAVVETPTIWNVVASPEKGPVSHLRLSCNLYSFNEPLMNGQMTLEQVLTFCAELGFDAVDPTAYYFPKYPTVPDDSYLYQIKRKAFITGRRSLRGWSMRSVTVQTMQRNRAL